MTAFLRRALYTGAVIAQLAVLGLMIRGSEVTLTTGSRCLFRTAPVDPVDVFRGKYVALSFSNMSFAVDTATVHFRTGRKAYAVIGRDTGGFATVTGLLARKPDSGDYVKVAIAYQYGGKVTFRYPFDKYFLDENKAARAEQLYRKYNVRGSKDTYAAVRLKDGNAVIEDLVIGGLPVKKALQDDPGE